MFRRAATAALCLTAAATLAASAPPAPGQQAPVFRSAVDLVHLDVSVLDRERRPVRGLTTDDFTVLEDGTPQPIVAFSAVDVPDPEPPAAPWMRRVSPDVQTNIGTQNPEGRLFVLLLDDAMLPPNPAFVASAKEIAKRFVDRVTAADRVAVVFSAAGRNQTFTNDRVRLDEAIDSLKTGQASHLLGWDTARFLPPTDDSPCEIAPFGPKYDSDANFRIASIQTLRQVAETLISAPQRRKALIFVSPGIEMDSVSASMPVRTTTCQPMAAREQNRQLLQEMPELFLRMRRANVTIYPIDPGGMGGLEAYLTTAATSVAVLATNHDPLPAFFDWFNPGPVLPRPEDLSQHAASLSLDFLRTAAENTGGLAVVNTNDFDTGIDRIFQENGSYYLIGYQEPAGNPPGSLHRLSVRVNRPDVTVRTRNGYFTAEAAPKPGSKGAVTPLDKAIAGAVPDGAFPMRATFAPIVVPGRKQPTVAVILGLEQPPVDKRAEFTVDLQTNAYSPDGRPRLVGARQTARVVLVPTESKAVARYDILSEIDLPPGRYELRLSAYRDLDNVSGSVYADVEVPDFASAPLSVSGAMVEVRPSDAVAPPGAFDAFVPVVPTSRRTFRRSDDVTVFMRIYQGGRLPTAPVEVTARVRDREDRVIGEGTETLSPEQFYVGGKAADYQFTVPTSQLPPGPYLLTFDLRMGRETATRSVQFTVVDR